MEWVAISRGSSQPRYQCKCCNTDIEPASPASPALAGVFFTTSTTWEAFIASISATFPIVEVENFLGEESHKWMS